MMLYHYKPACFVGKTIFPLNQLKHVLPAVHAVATKKYEGREGVPVNYIPSLRCSWGDVAFLTAVHPRTLTAVMRACGWFNPPEFAAFAIKPQRLDSRRTTVYEFFRKDGKVTGRYVPFDPEELGNYDVVSEDITRAHYFEARERGERPFLFAGIPHILYRGRIPVGNCRIVTSLDE